MVNLDMKGTSVQLDLLEDENRFYASLANYMKTLSASNKVTITCSRGNAEYQIVKKGTSMFFKENFNNISLPLASKYPKRYLVCVDSEHNHYKFYQLEQLDTDELLVTYGRVGSSRGEMFVYEPISILRECFG